MNIAKATAGADTIINRWCNVKKNDRLLIVTDYSHSEEAQLLKQAAKQQGCITEIMYAPQGGRMVGVHFDDNPNLFMDFDIIIGATDYSLVTTLAAKNAISHGKSFLSLPLHTNDGRSMLEYPFIQCDTVQSRLIAQKLTEKLHNAQEIYVTTALGTDIHFYKKDRHCRFFGGNVADCGGYSSASVEVYVPIEETKTHGRLVLDGSYGYAGRVKAPFEVIFDGGRIVHIQENADGRILQDFIEEYNDENMYTAGEFGIGLNPLSRCEGNCYIEDESSLGTFHI
ncbi:MAG: peptidase, partial [Oscillospiraceae bacterium]|nr:peptidase [Oscillospiraceae bacterium]